MPATQCPHCHSFDVAPDQLGQEVICPVCGATFVAASGMEPVGRTAELEIVDEPIAQSRSSADRESSPRSLVIGVLAGVAAVFFIGCVGLALLLLPAIGSARNAAKRTQSRNNLKMIALGFEIYNDANGHYPSASISETPENEVRHSWRVALLPYLDHSDLYEQYNFDEPWDSPNNLKLLEPMPDVYRSPFDDSRSTNSSYYVFTGANTIFDGQGNPDLNLLRDGRSSTILAVESNEGIPWTKPEDIAFEPDGAAPDIGGYIEGEFIAAMADGSVHIFSKDRTKDQMKNLIMPDDGNPVMLP